MLPRSGLAVFLSAQMFFPLPLMAYSPMVNSDELTHPLTTPEQVQTIYRHLLEKHWVPETGLFLSFVDTSDRKLSQQASTYEQGAVGLLALKLGDLDRARGIFRFFKDAWAQGPIKPGYRQGVPGLANFYNAEFGSEGIEKTIHVGPNAWAGLFAARLGNQTDDAEALDWALSMARWMANDLPHEQGGIAMGPLNGPEGIPWPRVYSTENNLSYYAFLSELLHCPHLDKKDRDWLTRERDHVEEWLVFTAFDRTAYTMNRGSNPDGPDRIRALDTITWLVAALGPDRMAERGLDPDRLMRMARQSFVVKVGEVWGVDPTDQPETERIVTLAETGPVNEPARSSHSNHRMIWYEGLGQYINALSLMADYSFIKGRPALAQAYAEEAREMSRQFDLATLKNHPAGTAFAYATPGKLFHDGWWSPAQNPQGAASSLVAAVWRCFAGMGVDPLSGRKMVSVQTLAIALPATITLKHPRPPVLYGTSEDMTVHAWQLLDQGDFERTIQQAQADIQEWQPWAARLQSKKAHEVGRLIDYNGTEEKRKEIFSYWALNDVAAAYFILGKALDARGDYAKASRAFQQIILHYSLAQIWDPKGWFWSPMESFANEYASRDPFHYGNVMPLLYAGSSDTGKIPN